MSAPALRTLRRVAVRVEGVVQGVGFRPFVHRIANAHALAGYVLNDSEGVLAEVEGQPADVDRFLYDLVAAAPALAHVETVRVTDLAPAGRRGFAIVASPPTRDRAGARQVPVTPDCAPCADCLRELRDPEDRRFRYPFVNCTNCGPRFTIVRGVPYDRPRTTMSAFAMCDACQTEYDDPADRRFHAQPNACPACGPQARLIDPRSGEPVTSGGPPGARGDSPEAGRSADAVAAGAALLRDGRILAVKGLGGYHLACRADDEEVVARLRARKHREDRPFALMVADVDAARRLARLEVTAVEMLESVARPIVLAPRRERAAVAASVAPRVAELGVMLPSTPLHHLLLDDLGDVPLVMTSGNVSDEPIAYRDEDAMSRLAPIADAMLVHDRPIHMRADDGVVRVAAGAPLTVRRSRGHVPGALRLPIPAPRDVLACGAELKSTFCVARGGEAWVGHHLGDLRNAEVLASFVEGVAHFEDLLGVRPRVVAHDLHPDYLSTRYALERDGVDVVGVQHHHAHLAACLAEHGVTDRAVGAIYDGAGLGADGTVWGGEILVGDLADADRVGSLLPVRLPGGDRAAREPWRMACAWLVATAGPDVARPGVFAEVVDQVMWERVRDLCVRGFAAPVTTSMGRLFDAVGALCGLPARVSYEGQAAVELEGLAAGAGRAPSAPGAATRRAGGLDAYDLPLTAGGDRDAYDLPPTAAGGLDAYDLSLTAGGQLDARATVAAVVEDLRAGVARDVVARRFHAAVARGTAAACAQAASRAGLDRVVLSGGVFLNRLLLETTVVVLEEQGLRVLVPRALPPGDGGVSYGQAAAAAARAAR